MKLQDYHFGKYLIKFEHEVVIPGLLQELYGSIQDLPIWDNKLAGHNLRKLIGTRFQWEQPAIISYYDVEKRSTGFMAQAVKIDSFCSTLRGHRVSFNSIKIEHIALLAPQLLECFAHFKQTIVETRFPK